MHWWRIWTVASTRDSAHQLTPAVGELHCYANITATQIFLHTPHPLLEPLLSTTTMPKSSKETEIQIQNAIDAYRHAENPKMTTIAREFQVPYASLRRRLQGVPSRSQHKPVNYTLNKHQEIALQGWIHQLDKSGCPHCSASWEMCKFLPPTEPSRPPNTTTQSWPKLGIPLHQTPSSWIQTPEAKAYWS